MLFFLIVIYGVLGYFCYHFFIKLHSTWEARILQQLLKEVYLYDCEVENRNEKGDGDAIEKTEIPVTKIYEASNKNRTINTGTNPIKIKRSQSSIDLPLTTKKSNIIRRLSED